MKRFDPVYYLKKIDKHYFDFHPLIRDIRKQYKQSENHYSDTIFLPSDFLHRFANQLMKFDKQHNRKSIDLDIVIPCMLWNYTKGVYKFDEKLSKALSSTSVDKINTDTEIPSSVLKRLPQWCCFFDFRQKPISIYHQYDPNEAPEHQYSVFSFFAYLDGNKQKPSITLAIDIAKEKTDQFQQLTAMHIDLSNDTVSVNDACDQMVNKLKRNASNNIDDKQAQLYFIVLNGILKSIMKYLLYVCSDKPDIIPIEGLPPCNPKNVRKSAGKPMDFIIPKKIKTWIIGKSVAKQIEQYEKDVEQYNKQPLMKKNVKPHIRKAHWHGYWKGAKNSQQREFFYKWLPPIFVKSDI